MGEEIRDKRGRFAGSRKRAASPKPAPPPSRERPREDPEERSGIATVFGAFLDGAETDQGEASSAWLADMHPGEASVDLGEFSEKHFGVFMRALTQLSAERLCAHGVVEQQIVGVDDSWRMVRVVQGPPGTRPSWVLWQGHNVVRVPGSPLDNMKIVREVFRKLGIQAAFYATEMASPHRDANPSIALADASTSRAGGCLVDGFYAPTATRRVMTIPVQGKGGTVVAGQLEESEDLLNSTRMGPSPLADCF